MKRRWEIDAVRGLMLVLMTLTHLPTRLTNPTGQPFGFVSAAEGFVLLSAFMAGMVYSRLAYKGSVDDMRKAFWRRALKVYLCQAAMLLFLFTVIAALGGNIDQPDVSNLMSFYLREPVTAFLAGLALVYEPALLDILPLYVLFMLVSPWILAYALKHRWRDVLIASCVLWLLAQFDLSLWLYRWADGVIDMPVPYGETGSFVTLSWQLVWVVGLWLGARAARPGVTPLHIPKWIIYGSVAVAIYFFFWRHWSGQAGFGANESLNLLLDKWKLGPLRLLDLTALVIVTMTYGTGWANRLPRLQVLETLGAASLPVFCMHLTVVLIVLAVLGGNPLAHPWWVDGIVLVGCYTALYVAAKITLWFDEGPVIKEAMDSVPAIDLPTPVDAEPIEPEAPVVPAVPVSPVSAQTTGPA